jgi:hypothetical protein
LSLGSGGASPFCAEVTRASRRLSRKMLKKMSRSI